MLDVHRAERADPLVDALAAVLADRLGDPFAAEVVAVPSRGVERWLSQQLSLVLGTSAERQDGVCANVEFPFPGRLIGDAVALATGADRERDPWRPERAVWTLLDVVDRCLDDGWLAPLAGHLRGGAVDGDVAGDAAGRRFAPVRHLADLFDHYAVHRPGMIEAWASGRDVDAYGVGLPGDIAWQAELWRRLRAQLGVPSPAERWAEGCAILRDSPELLDHPRRLGLFGVTRLPPSYVDALRAIAVHRDVHLFLLHPAPTLWDRITQHATRGRALPRAEDSTRGLARHPLLARWGQDAREMQLVVGAAEDQTDHHHRLREADESSNVLLHRIQRDIRADREPGAAGPLALDERDRSVQVHACHGRARQVEVLRDAILHLLADDPTLQPRDIIVMCPDIDTFSPLIHATFGASALLDEEGDGDDGDAPDSGLPELTVRLADRSLRQTNPVLDCLAELLALAGSRLTASEVIDFAGREPVKRRFRFDDDDIARIDEWARAAGVRWGADAEHRAPYKLAGLATNTWRAGADRLLLGTAMSEEGLRLVGGVLPLDDVDSGDIDLAGRLAELLDRLHAAVDELAAPRPMAAWVDLLGSVTDALTSTTDRDRWQRAQLQRILDEVRDEASASSASEDARFSLGDVRSLLADRLRGHPTRANFRTGHLTMCTLVPMRSVPHRVVCILGLDDGVFPRQTAPDGDDVLQRSPCVGDRDPRSEDRQLLLDALLAAGERLLITYSGRDERTNAMRPPAVPLGELLDVIDATASAPTGRPARAHVVVQHPLQPFDGRNFVTGALVEGQPWSFDRVSLAGARSAARPRTALPAFLPAALPPEPSGTVELDDLVAFVQHPVRAFLRQRLGVVVREIDDDPSDSLPVALDALERWEVGQRLLEARLDGADAAACWRAELARGTLPPGELGREVLDAVSPKVERIVAAFGELVGDAGARRSITVSIDLGSGRSLVGTVPNVVGDLVSIVTYSRLGAKHRLAAWVRLLALTASDDTTPYSSIAIGRGDYGRVGVSMISQQGAAAALDQLSVLVDLYDRGLCEPLPLYCKTSAAWASAAVAGERPEGKARREWETGPRALWDNEDRELVHTRVLGDVVSFDRLLADRPRPDEQGAGWAGDEPTRFGRYARRLWDGLLAAEVVSNR
ncbi:MAG: exodeoxyribonuclease V subunit gamma [Actinobacteria bacterium]|nr:exodeoxyribonuclease V subunit gamma [Actinomycetota bacterium]